MKRTITHLKEHFNTWFLDYASYVILERAVPYSIDGLKPVQRRLLHILDVHDDGYLKKVAKIAGATQAIHPHGDASIIDAFVHLGQKNLLIETQGSWGSIITGDPASAPRYIEARLSKLGREVLFNKKLTKYIKGYDGREEEPETLPVKFPLLAVQGAKGIAVGLSCEVLPHNFNESIDACICVLRGEKFQLIPDFANGGEIDASHYLDGAAGSKIKVRARIDIADKHTIIIKEVPHGETTNSLKDSIAAAIETGKIKIKSVDDLTTDIVDLRITIDPSQDIETTKAALYAFTKCEVNIYPNAVVIEDRKPLFTNITDIITKAAERTKDTIRQELELKLKELTIKWQKASLAALFVEKRTYLHIENAKSPEEACSIIQGELKPFFPSLRWEPTAEEILELTELKIKRIAKYDRGESDKNLRNLEAAEVEVSKELASLTKTTIRYFKELKLKYGKDRERKTTIANSPFEKLDLSTIAVADQNVYVNRTEGFVGTGNSMKKEELLPFEVNAMMDVVAIGANGVLKYNRPGEKAFYTENILDIRLADKDDETIFNVIYTDNETGTSYVKRFQINTGFVRDKEYTIAGKSNRNDIRFFQAQSKGQPDPKVNIALTAKSGAKKLELEFDFSTLQVKNREALGNRITKYPIKKIY